MIPFLVLLSDVIAQANGGDQSRGWRETFSSSHQRRHKIPITDPAYCGFHDSHRTSGYGDDRQQQTGRPGNRTGAGPGKHETRQHWHSGMSVSWLNNELWYAKVMMLTPQLLVVSTYSVSCSGARIICGIWINDWCLVSLLKLFCMKSRVSRKALYANTAL